MKAAIILTLLAAYLTWNGCLGIFKPDRYCKSPFTLKRGFSTFGGDLILQARLTGIGSLLIAYLLLTLMLKVWLGAR